MAHARKELRLGAVRAFSLVAGLEELCFLRLMFSHVACDGHDSRSFLAGGRHGPAPHLDPGIVVAVGVPGAEDPELHRNGFVVSLAPRQGGQIRAPIRHMHALE